MKRYRPIYLLLILLAGVAALSSCGSSKQVVYFQDLKPGETEIKLPEVKTITVRPEDKISIIVNSRDPQLTDLFNLPLCLDNWGKHYEMEELMWVTIKVFQFIQWTLKEKSISPYWANFVCWE